MKSKLSSEASLVSDGDQLDQGLQGQDDTNGTDSHPARAANTATGKEATERGTTDEADGGLSFRLPTKKIRSRTTSRSSRDRLELSVLSLLGGVSGGAGGDAANRDEEEQELILPNTEEASSSPEHTVRIESAASSQFATPRGTAAAAANRRRRRSSRSVSVGDDLEEEDAQLQVPIMARTEEEEEMAEERLVMEGETAPFLRNVNNSSSSSRYTMPPSRNAISTTPGRGSSPYKAPAGSEALRMSRLEACPETAIQVAPISESGACVDSDSSYDCSPKSMCGPRPWRVTLGILVALAIWGSIVLGIHVQKKVSGMEQELAFVNGKLHELQSRFLTSKEETTSEIVRLEELLVKHFEEEHSSPKQKRPPAAARKQRTPSPTRAPKRPAPTRTPKAPARAVNRAPQKPAAPTKCTADGAACILPFTYKGSVRRGCVRDWLKPGKTWCATKVDGEGNFISGDDTAWGYCSDQVVSC